MVSSPSTPLEDRSFFTVWRFNQFANLLERQFRNGAWEWIDHGPAPSSHSLADVAPLICDRNNLVLITVPGTLVLRTRSGPGLPWSWRILGKPVDDAILGTPGVAEFSNGQRRILCATIAGMIVQCDLASGEPVWSQWGAPSVGTSWPMAFIV